MRIFLSHARADRAFAEGLGKMLEEAGHTVWTDKEILPGDNWAKQIDAALSNANAIVALISPDALTSDFVSREWQYALGQEKFENLLIPVEIRKTAAKPWIFDRLQLVHASSPERAAPEVLARLRSRPRTRASQ